MWRPRPRASASGAAAPQSLLSRLASVETDAPLHRGSSDSSGPCRPTSFLDNIVTELQESLRARRQEQILRRSKIKRRQTRPVVAQTCSSRTRENRLLSVRARAAEGVKVMMFGASPAWHAGGPYAVRALVGATTVDLRERTSRVLWCGSSWSRVQGRLWHATGLALCGSRALFSSWSVRGQGCRRRPTCPGTFPRHKPGNPRHSAVGAGMRGTNTLESAMSDVDSHLSSHEKGSLRMEAKICLWRRTAAGTFVLEGLHGAS